MIKYTQNKLSLKGSDGKWLTHGNCYQTTIACLLEIPPSEVPNVEVLFDMEGDLWYRVMWEFLKSKGYEIITDSRFMVFHDKNYDISHEERAKFKEELLDKPYLVSGKSSRGVNHICIYQNGKMVWDCHPSREGILEETYFEALEKLNT